MTNHYVVPDGPFSHAEMKLESHLNFEQQSITVAILFCLIVWRSFKFSSLSLSATLMATEEVNYKPPSLPSYPEMIVKAIEVIDDKNGANKSTISKYIESTYGELPPGHTALLSHHLNKMKKSGELVFLKNNYMKPDPNAPPKRGRGRPPKPKEDLPPDTNIISSPPRPRGRPPKDPNAPPKPPKVSSGRPRGRPRKFARPDIVNDGSAATTTRLASSGRPRGRPPKVKENTLQEVSVQQ